MAQHNDFGILAEQLAADYLVNKGYTILSRNYRYLKSEIDIIARLEDLIIIIEVKARSNNNFINPEEAVGKKKIKMLLQGANHFLENYKEDLEVRFDIVSIIMDKEKRTEIIHLENAFSSIDII